MTLAKLYVAHQMHSSKVHTMATIASTLGVGSHAVPGARRRFGVTAPRWASPHVTSAACW